MVIRRLQITGRVQGVGFRYAMQEEAQRRGVTGWVRNRRDGSVEAVVQGTADAVNELVEWSRHGPPGARVAEISTTPLAAGDESLEPRFELKPTV